MMPSTPMSISVTRPRARSPLNEIRKARFGGVFLWIKELKCAIVKVGKRINPLLAVDNLESFTYQLTRFLTNMVEINKRNRITTKDGINELLLLRRRPNNPPLIFWIHYEHLLRLELQNV